MAYILFVDEVVKFVNDTTKFVFKKFFYIIILKNSRN